MTVPLDDSQDHKTGLWHLNSMANITRNVPQPTVSLPTASQFYNKISVHENRHYTQNTQQTPPPPQYVAGITMYALWNAQNLYITKLSTIKVAPEATLLTQVKAAIAAQNVTDFNTAVVEEGGNGPEGPTYKGILEQDAHRVSSDVPPFYLDWYPPQ